MNKSIFFYFLLFGFPSLIFSEEWHVKEKESNLVKFISSTSLLDFEGITNKIDGYIYWEGEEAFGKNNQFYFEVDLNSVETGIGKRDRDMREDVLETDKYPITSFGGKFTEVIRDEVDENIYNVTAEGKFSLHGIERETIINARIEKGNDQMNVTCDFTILLKDYNIEAPTLLAFIKVAEEIKLQLNFELEKITENEN